MEQSYRSTISIYKNILEQFNPALENLVYLGNNYLRTFHALSKAAEVYFKAIQKIGEQALQSSTSQMLGQILIQMSDTHRHMNSDLEVVAQTFHKDLLQHIEKNTKLDMQFIKENVRRLQSEMQAFVSESQRAAALEEKRRYRFLAEKHQLLSSTFLQVYSRACGIIQSKVPKWKEQLEASRNPSSRHSPSLLSASPVPVRPPDSQPPRHGSLPASQRSRSSSFGERAGGGSNVFRVQTIVPHSAGTNRTLLGFNLGDIITVLIPEAQNGWLYGKLEGSSMSGWFPEAFVKPLEGVRDPEELPTSTLPQSWILAFSSSFSSWDLSFPLLFRSFPLRSSHSVDGLDCPRVPSKRCPTHRKSAVQEQPPELFPRGTNPFATVKLRPTVTNDRSAPIIQ
ncbi:Brain-specific angiogenesis inhibitor 1-associated protein 2-like protein 2 [Chelonia mydas]|uniref:Brain-specific angiogenesis inhibitor 1-associated protein 2-like protein 2 n=1 Tax=Chelonia mydas TaxID=8469 RepID=M7AQX7_CHEMY|nr:Brain-specific angiogenesis inhibitor 1-associated protein 2-like protein 2 [Chelonia mydas]